MMGRNSEASGNVVLGYGKGSKFFFGYVFYFHSVFCLSFYKFLHQPRTFVPVSFNYSSVFHELKHHQAPFLFSSPQVKDSPKIAMKINSAEI